MGIGRRCSRALSSGVKAAVLALLKAGPQLGKVSSHVFIFAAESDPEFGKKAGDQLDKRKKVIVYCGRGGTLKVGNGNERKYNKDDPERMFGIETRSLKACHELLEVRTISFEHNHMVFCRRCDACHILVSQGTCNFLNCWEKECHQCTMLLEPKDIRDAFCTPVRPCFQGSKEALHLQAGFKDVLHLEGGLSQWRHDKYPVE